ncbi:serine/threonine protein kinase [Sandaracinus amylolyticus]|uniref:Serine/threonine protein kinase n=2 Tax=Sandaracinus amylolyticus TaxID=927083 RepID=A0A0F6SHD0_9BACT|nr:serine/threonine protein kinase [Sandaracinus amylolyticus]
MASVYLAQLRGNNQFAKWAALKVVHPRHAGNDRFRKMFITEARIVAQIDHPNVATVFDCGEDSGTYYLAMEYLSGQTLRKVAQQAVLRDRPVPLPLAARIVADAASGLHAAHELKNEHGESAGIVHRDVSPHNIFVLYGGGTKVMDFGIAFSNERSDDEHTEIDELKGKIAYMSPEQLQRFPIDRRSDVFSLGIVLWELVTGSRLFKRRTEGEVALALMRGEIEAPSTVRHECPPELDRIVLKALAKKPEDRYETAADFAADLEEFIISTGRAAGAQMVREYMHELFADEIEEHSTSLRKASEIVKQVESSEHELTTTTTSQDVPTIEIASVRPPAAPERGSRPLVWLVAGVVIAASGLGVWRALQWADAANASAASGASEVHVASPPPETSPEAAAPAAPQVTDEVAASAADVEAARDDDPEAPQLAADGPSDVRARRPRARGGAQRSPVSSAPAAAPVVREAPREERVERAPSAPAASGGPRPMTEFE